MGLVYTAVFNAVAVTAQQDFFELVAPSDAVVKVHRILITQSTEVGDAAEEGLNVLIKRGATTSGSGGGTPPTPQPTEFGFPAAGSTVEINNTTKASAGTIQTLWAENWNIRTPYEWLPTPECQLFLSPSQRLTVELATTPADSITMSGTLVFEEIGG
jgi:hypothetical protein